MAVENEPTREVLNMAPSVSAPCTLAELESALPVAHVYTHTHARVRTALR